MGSGAFGINWVDERVIHAVKQKYESQSLKLKAFYLVISF